MKNKIGVMCVLRNLVHLSFFVVIVINIFIALCKQVKM